MAQKKEENKNKEIKLQTLLNEVMSPPEEELSNKLRLELLGEEIKMLQELALNENLSVDERIAALNRLDEKLKEHADLEEQIEDDKRDLKEKFLEVTKDVMDSATALLGEHTAAGKATAVASATISTYEAAVSAFKSMSGIPIFGPALGAAAATAAVGMGVANVKEILSTKVPGAKDTTSSTTVSTPSLPSFPELTTPIQETHNNMTAYEEDIINQPQRVYVVESDITGTQKRVNVAESGATF